MIQELTITAPDDLHLHLRDGEMLKAVLPHTAAVFKRATVMPNLRPPVTNFELAEAYAKRIKEATPENLEFTPLIPLYLTDQTTGDDVRRAYESGITKAMKYYPAGATTNSDSGVTDITKARDAIETMMELGMPLLIHGEVTDPNVDMFDRESRFIDEILIPLRKSAPGLKVVMEHISTKDAVQYVTESDETLAATITPHHITMNRTALFQGGLNPHNFCLPILKTEEDRLAVLAAAVSGNPKFFLGTDSAPHPRMVKERAGGAAGLYCAYSALPLYAEAFEKEGALDKLEAFASFYGADFYGIERNTGTVTLVKEEMQIPESFPIMGGELVPMRAGGSVAWRVK